MNNSCEKIAKQPEVIDRLDRLGARITDCSEALKALEARLAVVSRSEVDTGQGQVVSEKPGKNTVPLVNKIDGYISSIEWLAANIRMIVARLEI